MRSLPSFVTALLTIAWYGIAGIMAIALCLGVASPFIDLSGFEMDLPVSFSVDAARAAAPSIGVEQARIENARGSLVFPYAGRGSLAAPAAAVILMLAIVLWALGQLRAVFRTLGHGRPFVPENAIRVRRLGYAVILGECARVAVVFFANYTAMTRFSADGLRFDAWPHLNLFAIGHGLIILAIAEVFRAGTTLDEDQSLTV